MALQRIFEAVRYHDFSCGHRVAGHESKCAHLHGHNYRIHFHCRADGQAGPLDQLGRVVDFSVIKSTLCQWLEDHWDHRMLIWDADDEWFKALGAAPGLKSGRLFDTSVVYTPFNPTAENMAEYLMILAPGLLSGTGVKLTRVVVEETRKCTATCTEETL